jgi:hypothetical protein
MFFLFYGLVAVGVVLLLSDLAGRLTVEPHRARVVRWIAIAAAAGPGLAPLLAWLTGRLEASWPFPVIAVGYALAFVAFGAGVLGLPNAAVATKLRRAGYLSMLALAALPSMVLLLLTPLVALAGIGLARPEPAPRAPARPAGDRS